MSNKSIEELVELAADGDEDAAAEIKTRFADTQSKAIGAERKLKLTTDKDLRDRYPRALRAWEKGHLSLDSAMTDEQVDEILRGEENKLAELGVPVETQTTPATVVTNEGDSEGAANTGAQALTGGIGSSGPGGTPRDQIGEYFDALKGSTIHDQARANAILVELNHIPGGKEKIAQITKQLEARPITLTNI